MRVIESGRLVIPAASDKARRFAEEGLVTVHGRAARLMASIGRTPLRGEHRETNSSPTEITAEGIDIAGDVEGRLDRWLADASEWVIVRDYPGSFRAKRLLFLFEDGVTAPFAALKLRGSGASGHTLDRERAAISAIRDRLPESLTSALPAVLDYARSEGAEILVLSVLPGRPLGISMQRSIRPHRSHAAQLASAGAWLGSFHRETAEGKLDGRADRLASVHGDLWPRNVLVDGDGAVSGVVDWEAAEAAAPFWRDLFTLPILYAGEPEGDAAGGVRRAFFEPGAARQAVRRFFEAYCRTSGIPEESLPALFEAFAADSIEIAGKEGGWRAKVDWPGLLKSMASGASVFSG